MAFTFQRNNHKNNFLGNSAHRTPHRQGDLTCLRIEGKIGLTYTASILPSASFSFQQASPCPAPCPPLFAEHFRQKTCGCKFLLCPSDIHEKKKNGKPLPNIKTKECLTWGPRSHALKYKTLRNMLPCCSQCSPYFSLAHPALRTPPCSPLCGVVEFRLRSGLSPLSQ